MISDRSTSPVVATAVAITLGWALPIASSGSDVDEKALLDQFKLLRSVEKDKIKSLDARFDLGVMLMEISKWDEAGGQFLVILEAFPDHTAARGNLAVCLQQEGQIDPAIEQYKYILSKEPKNQLALFNLAAACSLKKEWELAGQYYKAVLQLNPANSAAYLGLSEYFREKHDEKTADVLYKRGIELRPEMQQNKLRLFAPAKDSVPHDDHS